jgi:hypothetical protein
LPALKKIASPLCNPQRKIIIRKNDMRYLLIIVLSTLFSVNSSGQDLPWVKIDTLRKAKNANLDFLSQHTIIGKNDLGTVYKLRQDNMLCLVPDSSGLRWIPNAFNRSFLSVIKPIPNAYTKRKSTGK